MLFTRCIIAFIMIVCMRIYRDRQRRGCGTEVGRTRRGFRRRDTGNEGRWKRDRAMEGGRGHILYYCLLVPVGCALSLSAAS